MRSRRAVAFAVLAAACALGAVGYVAWAAAREESGPAAAGPAAVSVGPAPQIVFQHVARDAGYAHVALAAPERPAGPRTIAPLVCGRVHFAGGRGLCLVTQQTPLGGKFFARTFTPGFETVHEVRLGGPPSRARVSPDGRYGAATVFVFGHSYAQAGAFSTQTTLIDLQSGAVLADLEQFRVFRDGRPIRAEDFNFWGVTFAAESDRFYATLATGGRTYLVEADLRARTATVLHENVECPSLSPDGTRVAYKRRKPGGGWRLHVLDLATLRETPLAETQSVDDQVEWLDDGRILYGLNAEIWVVRADGGGRPARFIRDGLSPAVLR